MQILQLVGVLIIVNALTCAGWFVANSKPLDGGGITLLGIAMVAGLALTFHERAIEITFGKVATLKAAAQQATTDAKEITAIRQRVEAQAATLDLVAKESADAKRLLKDLREENIKADDKLKLLEQRTMETAKLAEPTKLTLKATVRNPEVKELCVTVFFEASKNEALGRLEFDVAVVGDSTATITKLWPSLKAGAFQSGDGSFQPSPGGKSAKLQYVPIGAELAAFDITLSGPAVVQITGNRLPKPVVVKIE